MSFRRLAKVNLSKWIGNWPVKGPIDVNMDACICLACRHEYGKKLSASTQQRRNQYMSQLQIASGFSIEGD